jgi:hypothetical protein
MPHPIAAPNSAIRCALLEDCSQPDAPFCHWPRSGTSERATRAARRRRLKTRLREAETSQRTPSATGGHPRDRGTAPQSRPRCCPRERERSRAGRISPLRCRCLRTGRIGRRPDRRRRGTLRSRPARRPRRNSERCRRAAGDSKKRAGDEARAAADPRHPHRGRNRDTRCTQEHRGGGQRRELRRWRELGAGQAANGPDQHGGGLKDSLSAGGEEYLLAHNRGGRSQPSDHILFNQSRY